MPLADDTLNTIQRYVEIRGAAFHTAYEWLAACRYPPDVCQHFATLIVTLMSMETQTGMKGDDLLKAQMKAMTPGGQA